MDFGLVEVGEGVDSLPVREYKGWGVGKNWCGGANRIVKLSPFADSHKYTPAEKRMELLWLYPLVQKLHTFPLQHVYTVIKTMNFNFVSERYVNRNLYSKNFTVCFRILATWNISEMRKQLHQYTTNFNSSYKYVSKYVDSLHKKP